MLTPSKKFLLGLKLAIFAVKWQSFGYFCVVTVRLAGKLNRHGRN